MHSKFKRAHTRKMSLKRERIVFDDDEHRVENDPSFKEYCELWSTFQGLLPFMCLRNMPTPTVWITKRDGPEPQTPIEQRVKRIQSIILDLKTLKTDLQLSRAKLNDLNAALQAALIAEETAFNVYLDAERAFQKNPSEVGRIATVAAKDAYKAKELASKSARNSLNAQQATLDALNAIDGSDKKLAELAEYEKTQIGLWNYMCDIIYQLSVNSYVERRLVGTMYELKHVALNAVQQHPSVYDALDHPLLLSDANTHVKVSNARRQSFIDGLMEMIAP